MPDYEQRRASTQERFDAVEKADRKAQRKGLLSSLLIPFKAILNALSIVFVRIFLGQRGLENSMAAGDLSMRQQAEAARAAAQARLNEREKLVNPLQQELAKLETQRDNARSELDANRDKLDEILKSHHAIDPETKEPFMLISETGEQSFLSLSELNKQINDIKIEIALIEKNRDPNTHQLSEEENAKLETLMKTLQMRQEYFEASIAQIPEYAETQKVISELKADILQYNADITKLQNSIDKNEAVLKQAELDSNLNPEVNQENTEPTKETEEAQREATEAEQNVPDGVYVVHEGDLTYAVIAGDHALTGLIMNEDNYVNFEEHLEGILNIDNEKDRIACALKDGQLSMIIKDNEYLLGADGALRDKSGAHVQSEFGLALEKSIIQYVDINSNKIYTQQGEKSGEVYQGTAPSEATLRSIKSAVMNSPDNDYTVYLGAQAVTFSKSGESLSYRVGNEGEFTKFRGDNDKDCVKAISTSIENMDKQDLATPLKEAYDKDGQEMSQDEKTQEARDEYGSAAAYEMDGYEATAQSQETTEPSQDNSEVTNEEKDTHEEQDI